MPRIGSWRYNATFSHLWLNRWLSSSLFWSCTSMFRCFSWISSYICRPWRCSLNSVVGFWRVQKAQKGHHTWWTAFPEEWFFSGGTAFPHTCIFSGGTVFPQRKYWGNGVSPRSPAQHHWLKCFCQSHTMLSSLCGWVTFPKWEQCRKCHHCKTICSKFIANITFSSWPV